MTTPHQDAAAEIFREVVEGPESSGVPEILAILQKHFPPPGRPLREILAEQDPEDEEIEVPRRISRVISAI